MDQLRSWAFTDEPTSDEKAQHHVLRDVLERYLIWYKVKAG